MLTPTEAAAERAIKVDPLRRLPMTALEQRERDCLHLIRLFRDSTQAWRVPAIRERLEEVRREMRRRAR